MAAPNPLKTTLRKVIIVRLESIMKKKPMDPVYTCEKYREIYPHKEDVDLLKQIRQKISGMFLQSSTCSSKSSKISRYVPTVFDVFKQVTQKLRCVPTVFNVLKEIFLTVKH